MTSAFHFTFKLCVSFIFLMHYKRIFVKCKYPFITRYPDILTPASHILWTNSLQAHVIIIKIIFLKKYLHAELFPFHSGNICQKMTLSWCLVYLKYTFCYHPKTTSFIIIIIFFLVQVIFFYLNFFFDIFRQSCFYFQQKKKTKTECRMKFKLKRKWGKKNENFSEIEMIEWL